MKEMFGDVRPNTTMCECDFLVISQHGPEAMFLLNCFPHLTSRLSYVSPRLLTLQIVCLLRCDKNDSRFPYPETTLNTSHVNHCPPQVDTRTITQPFIVQTFVLFKNHCILIAFNCNPH